jgi:hypothetical protein
MSLEQYCMAHQEKCRNFSGTYSNEDIILHLQRIDKNKGMEAKESCLHLEHSTNLLLYGDFLDYDLSNLLLP